MARRQPGRPVRFLWVGDAQGYGDPYLGDLRLQIARSGLAESFDFAAKLEDLQPVYDRAELCLLSSRQDGLPNAAIDAASRGVPVICFDQASGMAELLKASPMTRDLVVPYLDVAAAADLVIALAGDQARLDALGVGIRTLAAEQFDMARYVDRIDCYGRDAAAAAARARRDASVLSPDDSFNVHLHLGPLAATMSRDDAVARYLHMSRLTAPRGRPGTGLLVRRPLAGFHPMIYATECTTFDEAQGEDPLVHYIRTGRPEGPWSHQVIVGREAEPPTFPLRVVMHAHFHYPELLEDLIVRLRRNLIVPDLVLTTTSNERAQVLEAVLRQMNVSRAKIDVTPNRGRDIAPMLTEFGRKAFAGYDLVGHVHGKRSPHMDTEFSDAWRNFAWEHLVGGREAMVDCIIAAMAADRSLGLVFPEDPHIPDWDENCEPANEIASRMGIDLPLPQHIDFPVGTMFWARPAAIQPLQALNLDWTDFPPEPVPPDGSMLHALERLLPFSARKAGYHFATTLVDGSVR